MSAIHAMILAAGLLGLLAIFAAIFAVRIGTPLLLAFIGLGMLAGEDGLGGIPFDDFQIGYMVGSLALVVILFEGGLSLRRSDLRPALLPAVILATLGVAISCAVFAGVLVFFFTVPWLSALLLGAAVAPTDAAAVSVLLRVSTIKLPKRVVALLELESGLNDPMSVFLTIAIVEIVTHRAAMTPSHAVTMFVREMGGGALLGLAGGEGLRWLLRNMKLPPSVLPVLALSAALLLFGAAQSLEASGFLAVYLAGGVIAVRPHPEAEPVKQFFQALGWLAQIALFLMLGLLVTPHDLMQLLGPALIAALVLIFLARPLAVAFCLLPFGWTLRETGFVAWAGLRGGVPIYLAMIPVLANQGSGERLFGSVFVIVVASVALQGWTIRPLAKWLKLSVG